MGSRIYTKKLSLAFSPRVLFTLQEYFYDLALKRHSRDQLNALKRRALFLSIFLNTLSKTLNSEPMFYAPIVFLTELEYLKI